MTFSDSWIMRSVIDANEHKIPADFMPRRVVDIGANIGAFVKKIRLHHNPSCEFICVEPLEIHMDCLRANASEAATVIKGAISYGDSTTCSIYDSESSTIYSRAPSNMGSTTSHDRFDDVVVVEEDVPVYTIESVMASEGWSGADLLKLDCELCENEVLKFADLSVFGAVCGEYHNESDFLRLLPVYRDKGWRVAVAGDDLHGNFWMWNPCQKSSS